MRSLKIRLNDGFSLMELLVAVAIVGILAAIAIPSYRSHVVTANRTAAQSALIQLAATMERYRTTTIGNTYVGMSNANGSPLVAWFPATAPLNGDTPLYTLTISNVGANSYTVQATPIGNTVVANDFSFSLNNTGLKQRCQAACDNPNSWANGWDGS